MNRRSAMPLVVGALAMLLAGCDGGGKPISRSRKSSDDTFVPPSVTNRPASESPPPKPREVVTQARLMQGIQEIVLERVNIRTVEGDAYMGYTSDRGEAGNKFASIVMYGTPEQVVHAYYSGTLSYASYPDPAQYPDYMKRNIRIRDAFLANLLGSPIPEDVKAAVEWAPKNPDDERVVRANTWSVKVSYSKADSKLGIDVK